MKYNKFLIILALCMGISTNISMILNASDSWYTLGYNGLMRAPGNLYKTGKMMVAHAGKALNAVIKIPVSLFNTMSSWSTNKILAVVSVGIILLVGTLGKDKVMKWWNNFILQVPEQNQPINPIIHLNQPITEQPFPTTQQNETQEEVFTRLLKENHYTIAFIKKLQTQYKDNKALDEVLLNHYKEEYSKQINALPDKSNQSITNLINQKKTECTSLQYKDEPMLMRELGTNNGTWGLRMQALNFLQTEFNQGRLQLTQ